MSQMKTMAEQLEDRVIALNKELRQVESGEKQGEPMKIRKELRDTINDLNWWLNEG